MGIQDDGEGVGGSGFNHSCGSAGLSDGEPGDVIVGGGCGHGLVSNSIEVVIGALVNNGDVIVDETVPSTRLSSTPVTVTVCAVFQLAFVKVSRLVTVASPVSLEVMAKDDIGVGLCVQDDGEGVCGSGLGDACRSACLSSG